MSFLITIEELKVDQQKEKIVLLDVRYQLDNPQAGKQAYDRGHIPGAVYLDLLDDLSGEIGTHGGSHPLPDREPFAEKLGLLGIDQNTSVVIYDERHDMFAARCLWLLNDLGHDKCAILEGGWQAWIEAGGDTTTDIPHHEPKTFVPSQPQGNTVAMDVVKEKLHRDSAVLIDSRSKERYLGHTEPLYHKAGHIPGAVNYFWKEVLDESGKWKATELLQDHFSQLPKDKELIVSCGSGVSACPNILALKQAGFTNVKLYPGSFSDWISYDHNPVATGEE